MLCQKCGYDHEPTRACPLVSRADAGETRRAVSPYPKLDRPKPEAIVELREVEKVIRELYRTTGIRAAAMVGVAKGRLDHVLRLATGGELQKCPRCNCRFSEGNYQKHVERCDSPYGSKKSKS